MVSGDLGISSHRVEHSPFQVGPEKKGFLCLGTVSNREEAGCVRQIGSFPPFAVRYKGQLKTGRCGFFKNLSRSENECGWFNSNAVLAAAIALTYPTSPSDRLRSAWHSRWPISDVRTNLASSRTIGHRLGSDSRLRYQTLQIPQHGSAAKLAESHETKFVVSPQTPGIPVIRS